MTDLISPIVGQQPTVPDLSEFGYTPFHDVQPFSQRAASGYQDQLEAVVHFLQRKLVPYLLMSNPQAQWDANVTALIAAADAALTEQTAANAAAITNAINAIAQSQIVVTDPAFLAVLNSLGSASRTKLDVLYGGIYYAPPASGADDTTALQAMVLAAQSNHGEVIFHDGTYKFNLLTAQAVKQPKLTGRGKAYTLFTPADVSKPILTFQGGSGSNSGGYFSDMTFTNPSGTSAGVGVSLNDVCNVQWDRVGFSGSLAEAIRFHTTQPNGFTEFNHGEATIDATVALPIRYMTDNAQQSSFHGSGLDDGIVNFSGPCAVQIDNNAFPYNAPMGCSFFPHTPGISVFKNNYPLSKPWFLGNFRIENYTNGVCLGADTAGGEVLLVGGASVNTAQTYLGQLYLARTVYATSGKTFAHYQPWYRDLSLVAGTNYIDTKLNNGEAADVIVNVIGPNYAAWYKLSIWQNPFNNGGQVTVLDHAVYNNGTGIGEVLFYFENYQLLIKNDSFTNAYTAFVTVDHKGGSFEADNLRQ